MQLVIKHYRDPIGHIPRIDDMPIQDIEIILYLADMNGWEWKFEGGLDGDDREMLVS